MNHEQRKQRKSLHSCMVCYAPAEDGRGAKKADRRVSWLGCVLVAVAAAAGVGGWCDPVCFGFALQYACCPLHRTPMSVSIELFCLLSTENYSRSPFPVRLACLEVSGVIFPAPDHHLLRNAPASRSAPI